MRQLDGRLHRIDHGHTERRFRWLPMSHHARTGKNNRLRARFLDQALRR